MVDDEIIDLIDQKIPPRLTRGRSPRKESRQFDAPTTLPVDTLTGKVVEPDAIKGHQYRSSRIISRRAGVSADRGLIVVDTPSHADGAARRGGVADLVLTSWRPSAFDLSAIQTTAS